jgi:hypothetical protein
MAINTTLDTVYIVNSSNRKVSLELLVGEEGQTSLTNIKLNNVPVIKDLQGNFEKAEIGKNADLHSKVLRITTTIADTSKTTNLTSLTIKLSGGFLPRTYPLIKLVDAEGESVDYICNIEFFNPTA